MTTLEKYMLDADRAVLVVVDIQERLVKAMKHPEKVYGNTRHLIEAAKLLNIPTLVTEQYPKGLGHTVDEVKSALAEYAPIEKMDFSCCGEAAFMQAIKATGRTQAILCGMETHVCVLQTALGLLDAGYIVHFVADAICSRKKDDFLVGVNMARDAGAAITGTESALFMLLKRAGSDAFKAISKRIK
jgi:nicotinamidase-related amidase